MSPCAELGGAGNPTPPRRDPSEIDGTRHDVHLERLVECQALLQRASRGGGTPLVPVQLPEELQRERKPGLAP